MVWSLVSSWLRCDIRLEGEIQPVNTKHGNVSPLSNHSRAAACSSATASSHPSPRYPSSPFRWIHHARRSDPPRFASQELGALPTKSA